LDEYERQTTIIALDIDGNTYNAIQIGGQIWMTENLNSTRFTDRTAIPLLLDNTEWANTTEPARFETVYGMVYNGYAARTPGLCPEGWHVSTTQDWQTLNVYLGALGYAHGGVTNATAKALATTNGWSTSNVTGAPGNDPSSNNAIGFNGFPAGMRYDGGGELYITGDEGFWYTEEGRLIKLNYNSSQIMFNGSFDTYGFFVRCVKN